MSIIYLVPNKYISQMIGWLSLIDWEWKWSRQNGSKFMKFHIRLGKRQNNTLQGAELWGITNEWSINTNGPGV